MQNYFFRFYFKKIPGSFFKYNAELKKIFIAIYKFHIINFNSMIFKVRMLTSTLVTHKIRAVLILLIWFSGTMIITYLSSHPNIRDNKFALVTIVITISTLMFLIAVGDTYDSEEEDDVDSDTDTISILSGEGYDDDADNEFYIPPTIPPKLDFVINKV